MKAINYIPLGPATEKSRSSSPLLNGLRRLSDFMFLSSMTKDSAGAHIKSAQRELRSIGFSQFQLDRRESRRIAEYLHLDEHIKAGIRGHVFEIGSVLLVATDLRVLYLHDLALGNSFEEFDYDAMTEVSAGRTKYLSSVTLSTRTKTYFVEYVNRKQADRFMAYVASRIKATNAAPTYEAQGVRV